MSVSEWFVILRGNRSGDAQEYVENVASAPSFPVTSLDFDDWCRRECGVIDQSRDVSLLLSPRHGTIVGDERDKNSPFRCNTVAYVQLARGVCYGVFYHRYPACL
jgi:hypothetical protein